VTGLDPEELNLLLPHGWQTPCGPFLRGNFLGFRSASSKESHRRVLRVRQKTPKSLTLTFTKHALRHLIDTITALDERGVGFKSLSENIDTTTSGGKLVFHIFGALAEFEREIIKERTQAGLVAARSRGKVGGRPKALTPKEMQILRNMAADKSLSVSDICKTLGIGRTTFYRYVKAGERE